MKRLASMVLVAGLAVTGLAHDEFGPLAEAKVRHPEFFEAGAVLEASLGNDIWYVYCGDAEKCFSEETDSELYQEAEIQAKTNFLEYFVRQEKTKSVSVSVSGARRMYELAADNMRYVVMGAPKASVRVAISQVVPAPDVPVTAVKDVPKESKPLPIANVPAQGDCPVDGGMSTESEKPALRVAPPTDKPSDENEEMGDEEKLNILRARLERRPDDFNVRMRMARIFARQGKPKRAVRNYADAVRMMVVDVYTDRDEMASAVCEAAEFEERNGAGALALKHFRVLQRIGNQQQIAKATGRISFLLLHFQ